MTKTGLFFTQFFCILFSFSFSQNQDNSLNIKFVCGHDHSNINLDQTVKFASTQEAEAVVQDIMNMVGLKPNFKIKAARVDNAAAIVFGTDRYLLYSPTFISKVTKSTKSRWAAISIMAHEIGHHLSGHTLKGGGSRPLMELEADEFSGFILRKMGATLHESQVAMQLLASPYGSATHPGRVQRLEAIAKGWNRANLLLSENGQRVSVSNVPENQPIEPMKKEEKYEIETKYILRKIVLTHNPSKQYFITTQHRFVTVIEGKIFILGKLKANNNEKFPFTITMKNSQDLFVNQAGELITKTGKSVGFLTKI